MKKLTAVILMTVLAVLFLELFREKIYAQASPTPVEYSLPYPGILPDHPLYFVKRFRDYLLLTFTKNPLRQKEVRLLLADKKLVMGQMLFEKRKTHLAVEIITESQNELYKIAGQINKEKGISLPAGFKDKVALSFKKHLEVMAQIYPLVTNNTQREILDQAISLNHKANTLITSE